MYPSSTMFDGAMEHTLILLQGPLSSIGHDGAAVYNGAMAHRSSQLLRPASVICHMVFHRK